MPKRLSISELPAGPKRLANAFERAGWTWSAEEATGSLVLPKGEDLVHQHVYSVVVRGKNEQTGRAVAARWEALDRGKLQVAKCYMVLAAGSTGLEYSVTEVFQFITA